MTLEFDAELALGDFRFDARFAADQEIVVLFGHSGAGKSLSLQMIAGLVRPERGRITIDGVTVFDSNANTNRTPQQRSIGYVVQDLALFPHMTVGHNVQFGMRGTAEERERRASELFELLSLQGFEKRMPRSLSGGQQQRVALARALGRGARLLLLDEPFSALDESLRISLRKELLRLREELGLTIVFVTHDLREAHLLADRLAVFDEGRVLQFADRETVFRRPANRRVAELTGVANIWPGSVSGANDTGVVVAVDGLALQCESPLPSLAPGTPVYALVRAERVNLLRDHSAERPNTVPGVIREEFAYGNTHALHFETPSGLAVQVEIAARPYEVLGVARRKDWILEIPAADIHIVPG